MIKIFTGIIAFLFTFVSSVSLVGLLFGFPQPNVRAANVSEGTASKYAIRSLLMRDVNNGRARDSRITSLLTERTGIANRGLAGYNASIEEYFAASSSIKDAGLPADFRYAWRQHMRAWNGELTLLRAYRNGKVGEDVFAARRKVSSRKIGETWEQVLRIAARYGVNTNQRFYH